MVIVNSAAINRRPSKLRNALWVALMIFSTEITAKPLTQWIDDNCATCLSRMNDSTGTYILEQGEEALVGRAWLTLHAQHSIDVQYFIWGTDNVGKLAAEQLHRAVERGVKVRVLVDDMLIDAEDQTLVLLAAHKNVDIRIYHPNVSVGQSFSAFFGMSSPSFAASISVCMTKPPFLTALQVSQAVAIWPTSISTSTKNTIFATANFIARPCSREHAGKL